jgi:hypothetical protein
MAHKAVQRAASYMPPLRPLQLTSAAATPWQRVPTVPAASIFGSADTQLALLIDGGGDYSVFPSAAADTHSTHRQQKQKQKQKQGRQGQPNSVWARAAHTAM